MIFMSVPLTIASAFGAFQIRQRVTAVQTVCKQSFHGNVMFFKIDGIRLLIFVSFCIYCVKF